MSTAPTKKPDLSCPQRQREEPYLVLSSSSHGSPKLPTTKGFNTFGRQKGRCLSNRMQDWIVGHGRLLEAHRTIWLETYMAYKVDVKSFDAPPSVPRAEFYGTELDGLAEGCLLVTGNGRLPKPGQYGYSKGNTWHTKFLCPLGDGCPKPGHTTVLHFTEEWFGLFAKNRTTFTRAQWEMLIRKEDRPTVSHLCGNAICADPTHLTIESQRANNNRTRCFRTGRCQGCRPQCYATRKMNQTETEEYHAKHTRAVRPSLHKRPEEGCDYETDERWSRIRATVRTRLEHYQESH
jgi:hypothetical protein